jgi:formate dehydrogenase maturation protein FdhE
VNWLTHDRDANKTACSIAIHGCDTVVGHFAQILQLKESKEIELCPVCNSRRVRSHFDPALGADGEYYNTCAVCEWSSHPGEQGMSAQLEMDL